MNIVCLNCGGVRETEDPRRKFCGKVCRNRWNVKKTRGKPKREVVGLDKLREMIKGIETKPRKASIQKETVQKDEWVDPI